MCFPDAELYRKKYMDIKREAASGQGEIVVYHPDEVTRLEVRVEDETVWLTQGQLSVLFQKDQSVIARHIKNIFAEGELDEDESNMHFLHNTLSKYKPVKVYSLDVIISVGYRVKSFRGTQFRKWANRILKDVLLNGACVSQRLSQIDVALKSHETLLKEHQDKIDFFVRTSLPPVEGIFYDGQIFDAYVFATDLIRSAKQTIVLIDNYIDESVLLMLSKRQTGVTAEIRTGRLTETLKQDLAKHNSQYSPIKLKETKNIHDRFLIVDEDVYHVGASLKDLGKKLFAFSKMTLQAEFFNDAGHSGVAVNGP